MGKTILKVLCGVIAISCFLAAIGAFSQNAFAGIFMLVGAVLLFPFTWTAARKATARNVPAWGFILAGFISAFIGSSAITGTDEKNAVAQGFSSLKEYRAAKSLGLDAAGYAKHQEAVAVAEKKKQEEAKLAESLAKEAELKKLADCKADLQCWAEKNEIDAIVACKPIIQKMAKYDYEWTDGITSPVFTRLAWTDKKKVSVTYFGDEIKMQNGFGNFLRHRYACKYDPSKKSVLDVTLEAGRI